MCFSCTIVILLLGSTFKAEMLKKMNLELMNIELDKVPRSSSRITVKVVSSFRVY